MLWRFRAARLGRLRGIRVVSGERVGVLRRALAEADALWGAVVAEERRVGRRGRVVVAVWAQWGEERPLRLRGVLPDHSHREGGRVA